MSLAAQLQALSDHLPLWLRDKARKLVGTLPGPEIDRLLAEIQAAAQAEASAAARRSAVDRLLARVAARVGVELSIVERVTLRTLVLRLVGRHGE